MFLKRQDAHGLLVGMVGVKLGDRLLQIGCAHGGRLAAIASKVGLSGRAVAVVSDDSSAERARKGAEDAGVLVEIDKGAPTTLPHDPDSFDLVVVDDAGGAASAMNPESRAAMLRQILRILRPGGRAMIVGAAPASRLGKLFGGGRQAAPSFATGDAQRALETEGFKLVRTLAERDGLVFVEGVKPRAG